MDAAMLLVAGMKIFFFVFLFFSIIKFLYFRKWIMSTTTNFWAFGSSWNYETQVHHHLTKQNRFGQERTSSRTTQTNFEIRQGNNCRRISNRSNLCTTQVWFIFFFFLFEKKILNVWFDWEILINNISLFFLFFKIFFVSFIRYNIDVVCEYICKFLPLPIRDFTSSPRLIVIRSFDINRPGAEIDELKGGVAGGSIIKGILKVK